MKKMIAGALLAISAFFTPSVQADSNHVWAYVYSTDHQELFQYGSTSGSPFVSWATCSDVQGVFGEDIWVDRDDPTTIVLKKKGCYLINYSVTTHVNSDYPINSDDGDAGFIAFLNNVPVSESYYAVGNAFSDAFYENLDWILDDYNDELPNYPFAEVEDGQVQVNGQFIVCICDDYSQLQLSNWSENVLNLSHRAGAENTESYGNNVSASIVINRIDKHHDHD